MALAGVIVVTFIFPTMLAAMVWYWTMSLKKHFDEKEKKHTELIDIIEKVIATKDQLIETLKDKLDDQNK